MTGPAASTGPLPVDVPVRGGTLRAFRWPGEGPVVVCAHGITANALAWAEVARALGGAATLVAPDLRGRAASRDLPGPWGMASHADDLVAVLDAVGADRAVLGGHSMGGFVVVAAARRHPERVSRLVLVDGGLPLRTPPGVRPEEALAAMLGPALERLRTTFPTRAAYLDFWRRHPAFAGRWTGAVEAYVRHDLVGTEPVLRSSCSPEAIQADMADMLASPGAVGGPVPAVLLVAERGLLDQPRGLYDVHALPADLPFELVGGVNHYTILFDPRAAKIVAGELVGTNRRRP